jgi:starch synthase
MKAALQREMDLPERADVPLFGVVSRLASQKGIDLIAEALPRILAQDTQVVILGSGEDWAERSFGALSSASNQFRARFGMNEALAHRIEAGIDLFLMPSRYEPCGLNQMYSQRYGALPIVRGVGGLEDTVENGVTGFKFHELSADALYYTALWAIQIYRNDPQRFRAMQIRAMEKNQGWNVSAQQYEALYRLARRLRRR